MDKDFLQEVADTLAVEHNKMDCICDLPGDLKCGIARLREKVILEKEKRDG